MRYHTPDIVEKLKVLAQKRELLQIHATKAWHIVLKEFDENYAGFRKIVHQMAVLDCIQSLACVAKSPGYTKPEILQQKQQKV